VVALSEPALADTCARPVATACTAPVLLTVAMAGALLSQRRETPVTAPPLALRGVAVSGSVAPTDRNAEAGTTSTDSTPGGLVDPPGDAPSSPHAEIVAANVT
jgi:hypothetical protein